MKVLTTTVAATSPIPTDAPPSGTAATTIEAAGAEDAPLSPTKEDV